MNPMPWASQPSVPNHRNRLGCEELLEDDFFNNVDDVALNDAAVTDAVLGRLNDLVELRELHLNGTQVTDARLEYVKGLARLRELSINSTRVSDAGLEYLTGLTKLMALRLDGARSPTLGWSTSGG